MTSQLVQTSCFICMFYLTFGAYFSIIIFIKFTSLHLRVIFHSVELKRFHFISFRVRFLLVSRSRRFQVLQFSNIYFIDLSLIFYVLFFSFHYLFLRPKLFVFLNLKKTIIIFSSRMHITNIY